MALGDSYSAGIGTGVEGKEDDCRRGLGAYPTLILSDMAEQRGDPNATDFQFLSCTGATTEDVLSGGDHSQIDDFNITYSADFALLSLGVPLHVKAGTLSKGGNCTVASQRLNLGTYQFYSECDSVTYCNAATGQCEPKRCRKDVFPFGYADDSELPPMCPSGKFCPDEEDQCLDILPVDSPCQFNRDG